VVNLAALKDNPAKIPTWGQTCRSKALETVIAYAANVPLCGPSATSKQKRHESQGATPINPLPRNGSGSSAVSCPTGHRGLPRRS